LDAARQVEQFGARRNAHAPQAHIGFRKHPDIRARCYGRRGKLLRGAQAVERHRDTRPPSNRHQPVEFRMANHGEGD
jgi:hypothetical protein